MRTVALVFVCLACGCGMQAPQRPPRSGLESQNLHAEIEALERRIAEVRAPLMAATREQCDQVRRASDEICRCAERICVLAAELADDPARRSCHAAREECTRSRDKADRCKP
jgi:hypothetical protein